MSKDKKQAAAQGQQEEVKETPAPQGTAEEIKSETEAEEVKTEAPKAEETKSEEPKAEDPKPDPTAEYAALNSRTYCNTFIGVDALVRFLACYLLNCFLYKRNT